MHITRGTVFAGICLVLPWGDIQQVHAAPVPGVAWTKQIGTVNYDASDSVAVDAAGNVYISGSTDGDLGGTNAGEWDAFLTKFDPAGNELWTRQIGSMQYDFGQSVALDAAGNAYISGSTSGNLGGTNSGNRDAFLAKFDPAGNELWTIQIGSTEWDRSQSVAVDAAGNAYISGSTKGDLGGTNAGGQDTFLAKFDPDGNELWTTQIGSTRYDECNAVAVDAAGNAYISGFTDGDLGGPNVGYVNAFLTKLDPAGNELWSTQIGTTSRDESNAVAVDAAGNLYISGITYGDLGAANAGYGGLFPTTDAFLTKFDPTGNELWSRQIGTTSYDECNAVAVDAAGNAYISGSTGGDLGGPNAGSADAYLIKFDPYGNELWSTQIGTTSSDYGASVAVDAAGHAYISGATSGYLDGTNMGDSDAFLIKFEIPEPASVAPLVLSLPVLLRCR